MYISKVILILVILAISAGWLLTSDP